jgi:6-phosphogluconolactonase
MRHSRRSFLLRAATVAACTRFRAAGCATLSAPMPPSYFAYVGSRTTRERNARGDGINVYRVDAKTGVWTHAQQVSGLPNPSYLAFDRTKAFLYAVHGDLTDISAYRVDTRTGSLSPLNHTSTAGRNPVHLSIDPSNRFVIVANHLSSNLVVLARNEDGSVGAVVDDVKLSGKIGPHRVEQPFSKPHQVELDRNGSFIAVPDKGLDQVFCFTLDGANGKLQRVQPDAPPSREGAGPRHIAFHPQAAFAYVVNELDSTVTAYRFDPEHGTLSPLQILTTLPDSFVGNSRASEIAVAPNGRFLYTSNRGHDSIAIFAIDAESGRVAHVGWQSAEGRTPRFFALDPSGRFLFVANEDSDTIVAFEVDAGTGKLTPTGNTVHTGSPVCIVFGAYLPAAVGK